MATKQSKSVIENFIFLGVIMFLLVVGFYFSFSFLISLTGSDFADQANVPTTLVAKKNLNTKFLNSEKVKSLVIYPREVYNASRVRAGGKKCPFGGLD